jgi:hypothetical protein
MLRVFARSSTGKRLETMEIKMMLSMPNTTSKNVRVSSANQASAVRKISISGVYRSFFFLYRLKIGEELFPYKCENIGFHRRLATGFPACAEKLTETCTLSRESWRI